MEDEQQPGMMMEEEEQPGMMVMQENVDPNVGYELPEDDDNQQYQQEEEGMAQDA